MQIRKATKQDVQPIYDLIVELATFEKSLDQVINTPEALLEDGFGENPLFYCLVAEADMQIVGISLYYFRYSSWRRKRLYLEDIVVTEGFKNKGIGKALLDATIAEARQSNCTGLMWQVLDWNTNAINFYKKHNASFDDGWINVNVDF